MRRWHWAGSALLLACGGEAKVERAPVVAVTPTVADAGAPPPVKPAAPVDPGLPSGGWQMAIDGHVLVELLASKDAAAFAKSTFGFDLATLADVGIDPAQPVLVAEVGLSTTQQTTFRDGLGARNDRAASFERDIHADPHDPLFRIVVPVADETRAEAAAERSIVASGLKDDGAGSFSRASTRVELATAPGKLVIDVAIGTDARSTLADRVRTLFHDQGHAAPPSLAAGDVFHLTYSPFDTAMIGGYRALDHAAEVETEFNLAPTDRTRIAVHEVESAHRLLQLAGAYDDAVVSRVDIVGRRGSSANLTIEGRSTPGPKWHAPPAEDWKTAPSVAPDGGEGIVTVSRPLASKWKLDGDETISLTKSPTWDSAKSSGPLGLMTALAVGIPSYARAVGTHASFSEVALARFDRFGIVFSADRTSAAIGVITRAADAPCVLAAKPMCKGAERLRLGAPAVSYTDAYSFARLVPVKGSSAVVVATGMSKAALDALAFHATTAGPLDGSFTKTTNGVTIPWLSSGQRLKLDVSLDGNVVDAKLTPTP